MAVITRPRPVVSRGEARRTTAATACPAASTLAVIGGAVGLAYVVGSDGSPGWQVARVALVAAAAAGVMRLLSTLGAGGRGGVAFAAGSISLAVGVGIGGPHLAKTGVTAVSVAGLLALAAGLVLTVGGAIGVLAATARWWRLAVAPALLLAVVIVLYTLGQAVAFTNVPATAVGSETPAARGVPYRDVEFPSSDGVRLSGWYVSSATGAAVVMMHGSGSTRSNVLDQAEVLARNGYGVLMFDARGHGRSDGRAMDAGWWGDEDIAGAVSFLETQPDVDPARIAAVGMSMGGEEAIGAAAADPRLRAVVAEGAGQRTTADKRWQSEEMGVRGWLQERIDWVEFALTDLFTSADQPISMRRAVAAMAPRPALLIAGGKAIEEDIKARFIQSGSPDTVSVWVVPDAAHTDGLDNAPKEWEARVIGFLDVAMASGR